MTSREDASYRLRVAGGFLNEARQDIGLGRWRSTVDNSQLAVENAVKAVLALIGPVGKTHNPVVPLRASLKEQVFKEPTLSLVQRLTDKAEMLGPDIHIRTDYGDEVAGRTPWELFDEEDAIQACAIAEEAVALATTIVEGNKN